MSKTHNGTVLTDDFEVTSPISDQLELSPTSDPHPARERHTAVFIPGTVVKERVASQSHEAQHCEIKFDDPESQ